MYVSRYITAQLSQQMSYGRYVTPNQLPSYKYVTSAIVHTPTDTPNAELFPPVYITKRFGEPALEPLRASQIYCGRNITAVILRQIYSNMFVYEYFSRHITAELLQQMSYGRYITSQQLLVSKYQTNAIDMHYQVSHLFEILHPDTCLAPEAENWTG